LSDLEGYKVHAWSHRIALNQQKCSKFNKIWTYMHIHILFVVMFYFKKTYLKRFISWIVTWDVLEKKKLNFRYFLHAHSLTASCWCFVTDLLNQYDACMCCNQQHINVFLCSPWSSACVVYYCSSVKSWNHVYGTLILKGE
jgi:hypothetical protein